MWAKIKELSGDNVVPLTTNSAVTPIKGPSTVAAILVEEDTHPPASASTLVPPPVLSSDERLSPEAPRVTAITPDAVNIFGDGPTDPVDIPILVEPVAVPPREEESRTPVIVASTKPSPDMPPVDETPTPIPTHAPEQTIPIPPVTSEDEEDLCLFSTEIGLDLDEPEDVVEEGSPFIPPTEESDEEREARIKAKTEETAWKRKEILHRHTDWEYQLEDLKSSQMEIFKLTLYNIRKNAAKFLKEDSDIQRAISQFAADGDKYLRGAENYLKNLVKERKKQDKGALWERVVQKVKDKFEKRLDDVDRKVGNWYNGNAKQEEGVVEMATRKVANLAEEAQADLGLDYSWLDDVTVDDWTRYHDLMRCALISFVFYTQVTDGFSFNVRILRLHRT